MTKLPYPVIKLRESDFLDIEAFRLIDSECDAKFSIPIELTMENAGLNIARLATYLVKKNDKIIVGVGIGNNGGSGLVAARRLLSWGYKVYLNIPDKNLKGLILSQLKRTLATGATIVSNSKCALFIDAFFGFSQRLPLPDNIAEIIEKENHSGSFKLSVDLPSGFSDDISNIHFKANIICALAAPKKELLKYKDNSQMVVADIGIPQSLFKKHNIEFNIPFYDSSILEIMN